MTAEAALVELAVGSAIERCVTRSSVPVRGWLRSSDLLCRGLGNPAGAIMKSMSSVTDISPDERERIRLDFYRAHRAQDGLSSVGVRRDRERDRWFLDVGTTAPVDLPRSYRGLEVRIKHVAGGVNAVARLDQLR